MIGNLHSIHTVPIDVEVLAYHEAGKTFHPVSFNHEGKARMRWNNEYSQYKPHYLGWLPMPIYQDKGERYE